jgi:hypothetical protein
VAAATEAAAATKGAGATEAAAGTTATEEAVAEAAAARQQQWCHGGGGGGDRCGGRGTATTAVAAATEAAAQRRERGQRGDRGSAAATAWHVMLYCVSLPYQYYRRIRGISITWHKQYYAKGVHRQWSHSYFDRYSCAKTSLEHSVCLPMYKTIPPICGSSLERLGFKRYHGQPDNKNT